jgi:hypothetical protein
MENDEEALVGVWKPATVEQAPLLFESNAVREVTFRTRRTFCKHSGEFETTESTDWYLVGLLSVRKDCSDLTTGAGLQHGDCAGMRARTVLTLPPSRFVCRVVRISSYQ